MARGGINLAKLTAWRADARPDEARCLSLFGVGPGTLERIEAGEIELGDEDLGAELAERIGRFLDSLPDAAPAHGDASHSPPSLDTLGMSGSGGGDFLGMRTKVNAALHRKGIEQALVRQLRWLPPGMKPHTGDIRRAIAAEVGSCSQVDLRGAIERLRYQGKLHWSRLELSASMLLPGEGASRADPSLMIDEAPTIAAAAAHPAPDPSTGSGQAGEKGLQHGNRQLAAVRSSAVRAGNRPVPAPTHESEVQRAVREEADVAHVRRVAARAGCGKVVPATLTESVATILAEQPADLIVAINRRHKAAWDRILMLGRATARRPGQALYDVLERGLAALEAEQPNEGVRHAA